MTPLSSGVGSEVPTGGSWLVAAGKLKAGGSKAGCNRQQAVKQRAAAGVSRHNHCLKLHSVMLRHQYGRHVMHKNPQQAY